MTNREKFWGVICLLVILSAYVIPYTGLSNVEKWYGSFLLWFVVGIVVILINLIITRDWRS
ncbi:hypothetical protein M3182_07390 [Mesobacillus maritimus]|uniref:hypothetical protein n=1 Tax=Mesobacillus maritimus TaxID=1643336 RepID=UPI00203C68FE|nr:hypothetical protein [Mesobacillus maritimus]MCM3585570.1 hypothetical protein [Mesobacillus maritimus]MCM3669042.1 hypothetical protein [Mesobacillus maritimus]